MNLHSVVTPALKIAGIYLAFSIAWILLSDSVVTAVGADAATEARLQTYKGLAFVAASALLLFVLTRRYLARADRTAEQLRAAYDQTLAGWAAALDIRDHSTGEHTQRVTELTVSLAERFGIEGEALDDVRRGATLHDIGKMAVPDHILSKLGPLDDDEWAQVRLHPEMAVRMLEGISFLEPARVIPWCHHERWDGSGYPRGLKGEEIPFVARLFSVVDVYDALTSERPYREPLTPNAALEYIKAESGRYFDPQVVRVFVEMMIEREAAGVIDLGGRL